MPRIKNGILFAAVVLLSASNFVQAQTKDLVPPIDLHQQKAMNGAALAPISSERFLPLIGDVVDRAYYHEEADDWDKPTVATCQLNAPLATKANESGEDCPACNQSTVIDGWVVSKSKIPKKMIMMTTPRIEIQCERCLCECKEAPGCKDCTRSPGLPCETLTKNPTSDSSLEQYCDQVTKILVTTLNGSHEAPKAQQRAIQTALKMVAEKASRDAKAGPEKLLASQQQSLKQVLLEQARQSEKSSLVDENKASLEPVYAAQFRNSQQLKSLAETDQSIIRSLMSLEKKFASFAMMQRAKLTDSEVRKMMTSVEEMEQREQEISRLQSELETLDRRIKQLRISPVQPATHLEPAFLPERQLRPINDKFRR